MFGGLDPVIIFQFSKLAPTLGAALSRIPIISETSSLISQPPIPIYLSEQLFNIAIAGTTKSVDIETDTETLTSGDDPDTNQKGIQSSVEINIEGKQSSVALTLLSALIDTVYDKATSKEYSISFLYGSTTIFRGLLQSYSVENVEGTDKLAIKISLSKGSKNPVKKAGVGALPGSTGVLPGD